MLSPFHTYHPRERALASLSPLLSEQFFRIPHFGLIYSGHGYTSIRGVPLGQVIVATLPNGSERVPLRGPLRPPAGGHGPLRTVAVVPLPDEGVPQQDVLPLQGAGAEGHLEGPPGGLRQGQGGVHQGPATVKGNELSTMAERANDPITPNIIISS